MNRTMLEIPTSFTVHILCNWAILGSVGVWVRLAWEAYGVDRQKCQKYGKAELLLRQLTTAVGEVLCLLLR